MNFPWRRDNAMALLRQHQNQGHRIFHIAPPLNGPQIQVDIPALGPFRRAVAPPADPPLKEPRSERINVDGDALSYAPNDSGKVGVYIAAQPLTPEHSYFEMEILETGISGSISIGVVSQRYPLDRHPGWNPDSVAFHADDGKLFKANGHGRPFGSRCETGDRVGCGIKFQQIREEDRAKHLAPVFFTKNGKEMDTVHVVVPPGGLHPAVGLHSEGEEVRLQLGAHWEHSDVTLMSIDNYDEEWARLHDIRINGTLLEYTGRGKSIIDVGLAQARTALSTANHYFEIEIVDPGENCYIAIGLARKDYPEHRHPGWNKGSIAYHADDGKIFIGSGVGDQFGPRCQRGDIMGCGILFPRDYNSDADSDVSRDGMDSDDGHDDYLDLEDYPSSDSDPGDEGRWERPHPDSGTRVQVFFTRNGVTVGRRGVRIPRGGFFPTIGMLSSDEKVRVDLRPLTG